MILPLLVLVTSWAGLGAEMESDDECFMQVRGARANRTSVTSINFTHDPALDGSYCYDPAGQQTAAYLTIRDVATRQACEQLCAADVRCNVYGWHGSSNAVEAPSRCYNCAFYASCEFQRDSVCKDVAHTHTHIYTCMYVCMYACMYV